MKCSSTENSGKGIFSVIPEGCVIIHKCGRYQQVKLFRRGSRLFVESSKGTFLKLHGKGGTSDPLLLWDEIIWEGEISEDPFGLVVTK